MMSAKPTSATFAVPWLQETEIWCRVTLRCLVSSAVMSLHVQVHGVVINDSATAFTQATEGEDSYSIDALVHFVKVSKVCFHPSFVF